MPRWLMALIALAIYIPIMWLIGIQLAGAADWLIDGLRYMVPRSAPDTSQLDWLISITAMIV